MRGKTGNDASTVEEQPGQQKSPEKVQSFKIGVREYQSTTPVAFGKRVVCSVQCAVCRDSDVLDGLE